MLKNPIRSPISGSFPGSLFDEVCVAHPAGSGMERPAGPVGMCTPPGLVVVSHQGTREIVKLRPNPLLGQEMKDPFLARLDTVETCTKFRMNPAQ